MRRSLLCAAILVTAVRVHAENAAVEVTKESAKTAGHAVRDGLQTFGRSARDLFVHGPHAAGETWHANAARTKADAHRDKARVKAAAHD